VAGGLSFQTEARRKSGCFPLGISKEMQRLVCGNEHSLHRRLLALAETVKLWERARRRAKWSPSSLD
jgi:hypothetical protein